MLPVSFLHIILHEACGGISLIKIKSIHLNTQGKNTSYSTKRQWKANKNLLFLIKTSNMMQYNTVWNNKWNDIWYLYLAYLYFNTILFTMEWMVTWLSKQCHAMIDSNNLWISKSTHNND